MNTNTVGNTIIPGPVIGKNTIAGEGVE